MNAEQAIPLIGIPYKIDGMTPEGFNCWGLIYYVRKNFFDVALPLIPIGDDETCRDVFKAKVNAGHWEAVAIPGHGDPVLMRDGNASHVGIYLDLDGGGILHSLEGVGVVFTKMVHLRSLGFSRSVFYRIHK